MQEFPVYLIGTHKDMYRSGEPAKIIGVRMVTPESSLPRLCYKIQFEDGTVDWVSIMDGSTYEIKTLAELINPSNGGKF